MACSELDLRLRCQRGGSDIGMPARQTDAIVKPLQCRVVSQFDFMVYLNFLFLAFFHYLDCLLKFVRFDLGIVQ